MWIGPTRNISCCVDVRNARLEVLINGNPVIKRNSGLLSELQSGTHANAHDYKISLDGTTILQSYHPITNGSGLVFQLIRRSLPGEGLLAIPKLCVL